MYLLMSMLAMALATCLNRYFNMPKCLLRDPDDESDDDSEDDDSEDDSSEH